MQIRKSLAALVVLSTTLLAAPAHADEVRTLTGPGSAAGDVFLTYVGCDDFFGPVAAPQARINLGPATAPMGRRSMGLVPQGPGTAAGPVVPFASLAALASSVSAFSRTGTNGASYIWTTTPDVAPGTAWRGRASVAVSPGAWQSVQAAALTYTWTLVDVATRTPVVEGGQSTPAAFAAAHGDGAGYVVTGFGCDGNDVNLDAVDSGATVYDFEGIALATAISASAAEVSPGGTVTLSGTVRDQGGRITGDPLRLERRAPGGTWQQVGDLELVDPDATTRVEVPVEETTEFRWYRPESQYADEGWSDVVTVRVTAPAAPPESPQPEKPQADKPQTDKPQAEKPEADKAQAEKPQQETQEQAGRK